MTHMHNQSGKHNPIGRLKVVGDFLRLIKANLNVATIPIPERGRFISKQGEGSIFLSEQESVQYAQAAHSVLKAYGKDENLSENAVERLLDDALFATLDIQSRNSKGFDVRLEEALRTLHELLSNEPRVYTCCLPVGGFDKQGFTGQFGEARFGLLSERFLSSLQSQDRIKIRQRLLRVETMGQPYIAVPIEARDVEAAIHLARREVRRILDILNFFSDLVPYNSGWCYLPEEAAVHKTDTLIFVANSGWSPSFRLRGPYQPFSVKKLRSHKPLKPHLKRARDLLRQRLQSNLADTILTAVQWAGRATVEPIREQSFLLYAIAFETIILPKPAGELSYRLRTRTARLLGTSQNARRELSRRISHLYEIRSKVVHSGSYEVTDTDLAQLRAIVKTALFKILLDKNIQELQSMDELDQWFESKCLE